ncbi:hypothetical protein BDR04DRAFT_1152921 [Suillus decipiens]|nr:hypothetical protein BDR04DRAFT_1152921 [Suillus decipiens]
MSPAGGTSSTLPRANVLARGASAIEYTLNSPGSTVVSENIAVLGAKLKKSAHRFNAI